MMSLKFPASQPLNLTPLRQELRHALSKLYGDQLIELILFGSHARQTATADSDIDVMVVLRGPISPGDEILRMGAIKTSLNLKYDQLISVLPVAAADYQNRTTPLLQTIHAEGIPL
jgi:uncharacterized protein